MAGEAAAVASSQRGFLEGTNYRDATTSSPFMPLWPSVLVMPQ
jgi:hypothetical protein